MIDKIKLGQAIAAKRGSKNLRDTCIEIGEISVSTLSRAENGSVTELDTYVKLCNWLSVSLDEFRLPIEPPKTLAEQMQIFRKKMGVAAETMSLIFGLGVNMWSRYENGEQPNRSNYNLIFIGFTSPESFALLVEIALQSEQITQKQYNKIKKNL